jgi:hypothetical protein
MQEKIITDVLREAAHIEGGTQALATQLRAPEPTLARWLAGRAQTPLRAFLAALELVMNAELREGRGQVQGAAGALPAGPLVFRLGPLQARCTRCDGEVFLQRGEGELRMTSVLACAACGTPVVHGRLIAQLAKDAVYQSRAATARTRRGGS